MTIKVFLISIESNLPEQQRETDLGEFCSYTTNVSSITKMQAIGCFACYARTDARTLGINY